MPSKKDLDRFMGEMGEAIVAYELMKRGWDVMKHLGGQGYDLWATKGSVARAVEVKTTDPHLKTGTAKTQLTVVLSEAERDTAHFLVYYIHGFDTYFVIPKRGFPTSRSRSVTVFARGGKIASGPTYEPYRNRWEGLD
jgi:hypothetical protein